VLSICWAGLLLGEQLTWITITGGVVVILSAGSAVRVRLGTASARTTSTVCPYPRTWARLRR